MYRALLKISLSAILLSLISPISAHGAYVFTSHTFTNCGATGSSGPILDNCLGTYTQSWKNSTSTFNVIAGKQYWKVPSTGLYQITIAGAAGGTSPSGAGGRGAALTAEFNFTENSILTMLIGQRGASTSLGSGGGGGGSYIFDSSTAAALLMAGGGGGAGRNSVGLDASTTTSGVASNFGSTGGTASGGGGPIQGYSGTRGGGGGGGSSGNGLDGNATGLPGGGGAGWNGNGGIGQGDGIVAKSYSNGGVGGYTTNTTYGGAVRGAGGFGGGGVGYDYYYESTGGPGGGGGGGGGYTGGGGGNGCCSNSYSAQGGGGGGSYITGSNRTSAITNTGHGYVTITLLTPSATAFAPRLANTNSSTVLFDLVMSESVTGLSDSDFTVAGTGSSTCSAPVISGGAISYVITLGGCSPGTIVLTLLANAIVDSASLIGPTSDQVAPTANVDLVAPEISSVTVPSNATYFPASNLNFTVNFSESVTVTGSPRIPITIGSLTRYATYLSMVDARRATFRYTIPSSRTEIDLDGIQVSSTLDLNGGTIRDLASSNLSPLTFAAPVSTLIKVAQTPAAPTIDSITAASSSLSVYMTPGATNGDVPYNYQYSTDNGVTWKNRSPASAVSPMTFTAISSSASTLANNTTYSIRIRAVNAAGAGDSSTALTATPTVISIAGGSHLTTTEGLAADSLQFTATGGTSPYSFALTSPPAGVSITSGVITASSATPPGRYVLTLTATDSAALAAVRQVIIKVTSASGWTSSMTIALAVGGIKAEKGARTTVTATHELSGKITFYADGKKIAGCSSLTSNSGSKSCTWTPAVQRAVLLTARLVPTDSDYAIARASITVGVVRRTGLRG